MKIKFDERLKEVISKNFDDYLKLNYQICKNEKHDKIIEEWFNNLESRKVKFPNYDYAFDDFLNFFKGCIFYLEL